MKQSYVSDLDDLLNDIIGGAYIGGTLCQGEAWFSLGSGKVYVSGSERDMSQDEIVLVARLYLKHKNSNCAFYNDALKIVSNQDGGSASK